jgi:hypothetical protein
MGLRYAGAADRAHLVASAPRSGRRSNKPQHEQGRIAFDHRRPSTNMEGYLNAQSDVAADDGNAGSSKA